MSGPVREDLDKVASEEDRIAEARRRLVELAERSEARLGRDYRWNREALYEDRLLTRNERARRGDGEDR